VAPTTDAQHRKVGTFFKRNVLRNVGSVGALLSAGVKLNRLVESAAIDFCIEAIREAIPVFNRKIKGFCFGRLPLLTV